MTRDELIARVKTIVATGRRGAIEDACEGYRALFSDLGFLALRAEDQRSVLRLLVLAKGLPSPAPPVVTAAFEAAILPLTELVSTEGEPGDFEMLGVAHLTLGHEAAASGILRAGLALERQRNPSSDLCGELMKRISLI